MIEVYRAIKGKQYYHGEVCFTGVNNDEIAEQGICCCNYSREQFPNPDYPPDFFRHVDGLPVFLTLQLAVNWLRTMRLGPLSHGLAILAIAHIDEAQIEDGTIQIIHNEVFAHQTNADRVLTLRELLRHQSGEHGIEGECFIPNFPCDAMLASTTILTPRMYNLDGTVDLSIEPALIDLSTLDNP